MTILGIETSCDETALALIETRGQGGTFECRVIQSLIHSQAELHSPYGGVFPTLAKREHEKNLPILLEEIMTGSPKIDMIAVTEGPGLEPALWTGITFAEALSKKWNTPVIPVNHMEGHIVGSLLKSDEPNGKWQKLKELTLPAIALLISGGHTELVEVKGKKSQVELKASIKKVEDRFYLVPFVFPLSYSIIGQTKDDAVGEAFDKAARLLGLPYPGGPRLSKLAEVAENEIHSSIKHGHTTNNGDGSSAAPRVTIKLPRPMIKSGDLNFSFSGLKTAVLYAVRNAEKEGQFNDTFKREIALEFGHAVTETLDAKLRAGIEKIGAKSIIVGGGVSANKRLRSQFTKTALEYDIPLYLPSQHISGDNALMIALAGALQEPMKQRELRAHGTKKLGTT